jgi:hypothetical protein
MSWWKSLLLGASALVVAAGSAAAEPLNYNLLRAALTRVLVDGHLRVTYTPPLGLGEPVSYLVIGSTDLSGSNSGLAVADVGLPDQFAGGANGLLLSAFDAQTSFDQPATLFTNVFDGLVTLLPELPIPLAGAVVTFDIADLQVSSLGPLESDFLSLGEPNQWHWAGVTPLHVSGQLNLLLTIPSREPIQFASGSFGVSSSDGALAGSFTGDATSTTLVVGLEDATVNPETDELLQEHVIDLSPLGVVTLKLNRLRLAVNGSYTGVNRQYGLPEPAPPPPAAVGCGIGPELAAAVPLLAWLRRRRALRIG